MRTNRLWLQYPAAAGFRRSRCSLSLWCPTPVDWVYQRRLPSVSCYQFCGSAPALALTYSSLSLISCPACLRLTIYLLYIYI